MAVHYAKELLALARERKHQPATIAVGKDQVWQGTANTEAQILLLQLIDAAEKREVELQEQLAHLAGGRPETLTIPGMETPPKSPPLPTSANGFTPDRPHSPPRKGRKKGPRQGKTK